jgi:hypothetical protein
MQRAPRLHRMRSQCTSNPKTRSDLERNRTPDRDHTAKIAEKISEGNATFKPTELHDFQIADDSELIVM